MKAIELATLIPECCAEVLEAMYFTSVLGTTSAATMPEPPLESANAGPGFAFTLHFAGDLSGHFGLCLHANTARTLAANFLGEDASEISTIDVSEVIGELANMLCGSVMSRVEGEHKFILSHPEPTPAPTQPIEADALVSTLNTDSGEILVWVSIEATP